jgi:hypothetical protein
MSIIIILKRLHLSVSLKGTGDTESCPSCSGVMRLQFYFSLLVTDVDAARSVSAIVSGVDGVSYGYGP